MFKILVINVGSTSVKLALFDDARVDVSRDIALQSKASLDTIADISASVRGFLEDSCMSLRDLHGIAARGGLLRPIPGGTYVVNESILDDLRSARYGMHASNLSGIVADELAREAGIKAYIIDPVTVDELMDEAKVTGIPSIRRRSIFHALSQKAAARRASKEIGKKYEESSLIVAHMGGGISIGAHLNGRVVDVNNALDGDGPITPERAGTIPAGDLARLCFSGKFSQTEVARMLIGCGGIFAYFGSNDMRLLDEKIAGGDETAKLMLKAMSLSIGKQIGAMAVVLSGNVDAVVLTGGLVNWQALVSTVENSVRFIAPVIVYPQNLEMQALAEGVLRVLKQEEPGSVY